MSHERLPKGAYAALEGLQAQAAAAIATRPDNDAETVAAGRKRLASAHAQMAKHTVWVNKIVKALMNSKSSVTVQTADAHWLAQTFTERVAQWPPGEKMGVQCPNCHTDMAVDIVAVREWDMDCRPVDCDTCFAEFELHADGHTVLMSAPPARSTAKGREPLDSPIYFDPDASKTAPNITAVEILLGCVGRLTFPDGTQQFIDNDEEPVLIYSPRLTPEELERFCDQHLDHYKRFHQENEEQLKDFERVAMEAFW
jgi:hypothetical protein